MNGFKRNEFKLNRLVVSRSREEHPLKVGICTGGGDCPGLNAVIRAVVKSGISSFGWEVWGIRDSFNGLMSRPFNIRQLQLDDVAEVLSKGGTILGTTNEGNPFKTRSKEDRASAENKSKLVVEAYHDIGLDGLIVVGGDGTQAIAAQFVELGLKIVGVPKTIDNDLAGTEQTLGFETAVEVATDAISRLTSTAESHERIMILEVMGRDAGHIALHSGLAGGAHIILIPEIPFTWESVIAKIDERRRMGRHYSVIIVAEGAHELGKNTSWKTNASGSKHLGGIGGIVAHELHTRTGAETRVTVLGHIQRGGSPCARDRILATAFGAHATKMVSEKRFGRVVVLSKGQVTDIPYKEVAGKQRPVEADSIYLKAAEETGVSLGRKVSAKGKKDNVPKIKHKKAAASRPESQGTKKRI